MKFYEKELISFYLDGLTQLECIISAKQRIILYQHPWLGKVLVINGEIQHIEEYQALYHEMLVHLPIAFIPIISEVLILGGGSLFAAYEVLKYSSVKNVILCDYDHEVIELMERHYPHARSVLNDTRFKFIEMDGNDYIKKTLHRFDLVINDCFNLSERSKATGESYYSLLSDLCTQNGLCVDIIYRHIFDRQTTIDALKLLQKENHAVFSLVTIPEYPGILHVETIWGKAHSLSQSKRKTINQIQIATKEMFKFYNPDYLSYYLYLPPYIKGKFNL